MGFLSKVTKGITKAADMAFNPSTWVSTAKQYLGSGVGNTAVQMAGDYWMPGLGSIASGLLSGDYKGAANSALDMFTTQRSRQQQEQDYSRAVQDQQRAIDSQNTTAREIAYEANASSERQARLQMDWQNMMSNTAHQREIVDLKNAGLNPILSGSGGMGASTPAGAQGSVTSAPVVGKAQSYSSAADIVRTLADTTKLSAATALTNAQTRTERQRPANVQMDTDLKRTQDKLAASTQKNVIVTRDKIKQETRNLEALHSNILKTGKQTEAQTAQIKQTTENLKQAFRTLKVEANLSEEEINYWSRIIGNASGAGKGTLEAIRALKTLFQK